MLSGRSLIYSEVAIRYCALAKQTAAVFGDTEVGHHVAAHHMVAAVVALLEILADVHFAYPVQVNVFVYAHVYFLHGVVAIQRYIHLALEHKVALVAGHEHKLYQRRVVGLEGVLNVELVERGGHIGYRAQKLVGEQRYVVVVNINILVQVVEVCGSGPGCRYSRRSSLPAWLL